MKEQDIVISLKQKTENACELFLKQYRPLINYVVTPFLTNEQDIEECINDIALKVLNNVEAFDNSKGSFKAWITAIARNDALNKSRSNKKGDVSLDSDETGEISSFEPTPEELLLKKEKQQLIIKLIRELPEREKIIFYRKYYYHQSNSKIAAELGVTERSVEGKLYRIRKKLRDGIGGELYD